MAEHRQDARLQEAACWVLKELARYLATAATRTTFIGAQQAIMKALEGHAASAPAQTAAEGALRVLAAHDESGWVKTATLGRVGRFGRAATNHALAAIQEQTESSEEE